jgi:hypothetical protein
MTLEKTSHREFFRRRVNQRNTNPRGLGRSDHPCDPLSRWKTYAFSRRDGNFHWLDQHFEAVYNNSTDSYITIKLNGHVRTVVTSLAFSTNEEYELEFNKEYRMCHLPQEYADGWFWLVVDETSSTCQALSNPLVQFYQDSVNPPLVLNLPEIADGVLEHIDEERSHGGEYILMNGLTDSVCSQLNDVTEQ